MDSPTRVNAIDLLLRINGKGFAVAVNCLLASESEYGQSDGLEIAASRPNAETLQRLTAMCDYSEPRNGHYWEQSKAAQILAENSHWEPVVDLVRKIGLQTLTKVTDLPRCGFRPSVNLLQPVVKLAKQNPAEMRPGDLLALGYGTDEHARILAKLKDEFAPGSEEARALVVALEIVKNKSTDNVPFLRNQLVQADRFFNAANALIENGTSEALLALSDNAADDLTGAIAINLINRLPESTDAVKRSQRSIVNAIKSGKSWDLSSDLEYLRRNINDVSKVKQLFEAKEIEEFLRREAFADEGISWSTGSKASTIRCLAILDSDAAFVAAKTALLNHKAHDRDYYPSLLLELDERTGATLLLKQLENESNHVIRTAIGRALGRINTLYFLEVLRDGSDLEKQVVCFACRWQKSSAELKAALKLCIDDKSEKISRQAITTCIALGIQEEALRLAERIMCEKVESERWLILTCLLELSDPGDKHHIWPIHCPNIWSILSPLQRSKALKRLNKRQEDETAELKRTTE